ncbi:hypothetical protein FB451DRAFT_1185350 [Mycena latifolia]|nr:hypothetical protein FB451DRAFT_1185350 [Mycena latifolia]
MAEVIGLVASVLQLVDTVTKTQDYIHNFRDAPKAQQQLLVEIQNLEPLIRELDMRITPNQVASSLQELEEPLLQLKAIMEQLTKRLASTGIRKLCNRLTWPLWGKKEVQERLNTIERFKSLLNAWLGMDILSALKETNEEQQINQNWIHTAGADIAKSVRDVARNQEHYHEQREQIVEWFSPLNFFLRQADILSTRQSGTGEWFLEEELFRKWKSGAGEILWARGMPTLESRSIGVAVIYLSHQEIEAQSLSILLAGLWRQLVVQKPISPVVRALYDKHRQKRTRPSLEEVDSLLCLAISELSKVFIVVDAIDEYPEQQRHILLRHLSSLTAGSAVNLMLTSRPHLLNLTHVVNNFQTLEVRATENDVRRHVDAEILKSSRLSRHIENCPNLRKEIEEIIVRRSDGMFLLAKLQIDSLTTKHTVKAVRDALTHMPGDLTSTYNQVVERINQQSEEDKNLLGASSPGEALAVEQGTKRLDRDNLLDMDIVLSVCAGLVVINEADKRIRLIHYTTQNYFDDLQATTFLHASTEITMTCITYLSFNTFSQNVHNPMILFHQHSFLDYAVEYGLAHARGRPESDIKDSILSFLWNSSVWWKLWNWKHSYEKRRQSEAPLWIAAAFHLDKICRHLIKEVIKEGDAGTVLHKAALGGLTDMVQILITNGVNSNAKPWHHVSYFSALQAASARGHADIIRLLLDHGADIDFTGQIGSALQLAAFFGHKQAVCLLILRGANVNVEGGLPTALIAASVQNHYDIIEILLDHGANIDAKCERYISALFAASMAGHKAIFDLLIQRGAKPHLLEVDAASGDATDATGSFNVLSRLFHKDAPQPRKSSSVVPASHRGPSEIFRGTRSVEPQHLAQRRRRVQ